MIAEKYSEIKILINPLKAISILLILLAFASPAYAGTPVVDTQISFTPSLYPGESSTLKVIVSEVSGSDWVKDATVSVQISPSSGVVITPSSQSVSRIDKKSSHTFTFPIEIVESASSGNRNIIVTVKYYEMDLLNINTLGPYYLQDNQYFNINNPYGKISVNTNPQNADIFLDGQYKGTSPMTISNVIQGKHTLLLKKEGYNDVSTSVTVIPDSQSAISKILSLKTGSVSVSTTPSGAKVYIDDKYIGASPLTSTGLLPGSHAISISMNGYRDVSDTFIINADSSSSYKKLLVKQNGNIDIDSTPSGAKVYLSGSYKGVTPLYLESISPDTYNINVVKDGYKDLQRTVTVKDGSTVSVSASLEKMSIAEKVVKQVSEESSSISTKNTISTKEIEFKAQLLEAGFIVFLLIISFILLRKIFKNRVRETPNIGNQNIINNIHYGDNIETNITDSVVQRTNIGSKRETCPYCNDAASMGDVCSACGRHIENTNSKP
ncbi:PEGA domain-containing protein [Methanolobus vulcani]|uniref:PEGA domain-containing protein n=1 Tax=Methanolobus vulcani TaxID=38026 RepID=A0A7Z7AWD1_9EURY|nr:PEGA domain-containing protein [Methanolobus vulcani]SDF80476.1 PEGA domain-containing protein [Methanolobus vulcani]